MWPKAPSNTDLRSRENSDTENIFSAVFSLEKVVEVEVELDFDDGIQSLKRLSVKVEDEFVFVVSSDVKSSNFVVIFGFSSLYPLSFIRCIFYFACFNSSSGQRGRGVMEKSDFFPAR